MDKVIRDNKIAVLTSSGFGAGWYSWNRDYKELLYHPKLIEMIETGNKDEITTEWIETHLGIKDIYCGGVDGLTINWIDKGTAFKIDEYAGAEGIITIDDFDDVA